MFDDWLAVIIISDGINLAIQYNKCSENSGREKLVKSLWPIHSFTNKHYNNSI